MSASKVHCLIFGAALVLGSSSMLSGQSPLDSAAKLSDLTGDGSGSFEMDGDFTAQTTIPLESHFVWKWKSKTAWWRKITMGVFEQVEVSRGDTRYILRNLNFEPQRVMELKSLLSFSQSYESYNGWNQKKRKLNGAEVSCIQTKDRIRGSNGPEVCIDPVSNQIAFDTEKLGFVTQQESRREFADYIAFGGHQFPSRLKLRKGASVVLTAHIASLKAAEIEDAVLTPPPGAIERRECQGMKPPALIHGSSGGEPPVQGSGGTTRVSITIGTDGSVTDAHLNAASTKEMDEMVLKSFRGWKFQAAMCGNEPVVTDAIVETETQKY